MQGFTKTEWNQRKLRRPVQAAALEAFALDSRRKAAAAQPPPAPSLEICTLDDHGIREGYSSDTEDWQVKALWYPCGAVEVSAYTGRVPAPRVPSSESSLNPPAPRSSPERAANSIARSRALLRRRVLALNADHMLTLTKRGKFAHIDDVWAAFRLFSRAMKRRFGDRWRYVAVPELHSDGETWHMHVALRGFFWVGTVRRLWYRALGGSGDETGERSPGNIDAKHFNPRAGVAAARSVAGYVAKYVGKGFERSVGGRKLYAATAGLNPIRICKWSASFLFGSRDAAVAIARLVSSCGARDVARAWFWNRGNNVYGFRLSMES